MSGVLAYWLGFFTLPVALGGIFTVLWSASPSPVYAVSGSCPHCTALGWNTPLMPRGEHRTRLAEFVAEQVVHEWRARRWPHRRLWQQAAQARPDAYPYSQPRLQRRYGVATSRQTQEQTHA